MKTTLKEVELCVALPGFKKQDIKVKLTNKNLSVQAKKSMKKRIQKKDFFHVESSNNIFVYQTTLPEIDSKKAKITFSKEVLKIKAPKKR